ncbi:MAG: hypothetical protein INF93_12075 [Rhodobacter sp.]|nr:hypothetical protein [Rhodobacter sp.]
MDWLSISRMNFWLNFIDSLAGHLAWPILIAFLAFYFSSPVRTILNRTSRVKFGDAEFEFKRDAKEFVAEAVSIGITVFYPRAASNEYGNARDYVLNNWIEIEKMLTDWLSAQELKPGSSRNPSIRHSIEALRKVGRINNELAALLLRLQSLRNELVHQSHVPLYGEDKQELLGAIKSIKSRLKSSLDVSEP